MTTSPLTRTMKSACAKLKTVHSAHLERNGAIVLTRNPLQLFLLLLMIAVLLLRLFSVPFVPTQSNVDNPRHTISATIAENTDTGNPSAQRLQFSPAPPVLALTNRSVEKYVDQNQSLLNNQINLFLQHVAYFENSYVCSKGVKSSLAKNVQYWQNIGASEFVIDIIKNG